MNDKIINTLDKVKQMREAQKAYFDCVKRHDYASKDKYLTRAKGLEKEVDKLLGEVIDETKNGKQGEMF